MVGYSDTLQSLIPAASKIGEEQTRARIQQFVTPDKTNNQYINHVRL